MSAPLNVEIYVSTDVLHLNQIYVGMGILAQKGLIKVTLKKGENTGFGTSHFSCNIENKKVVFEMHDRPRYLAKDVYEWCDFYVKRSVTPEIQSCNPKIIPWGLNFYITSIHDFSFRRALLKQTLKEAGTTLIRSNYFLSLALNIKNGASAANINQFKSKPFHTKKPIIVFSPRLWDPNRVDGEKREERFRLNNERITFVRELRKYFPEFYYGGVEDTEYARKVCLDLILPARQTHKKNYLNDVRNASIGIATGGLVDSIGWKFCEYIILSKAIVSNSLKNYLLHKPLMEEKNYLPYSSTENFLCSVEQLIKNDDLRFEMMNENYKYSLNYLMPEKQLAIALRNIGFDLADP